jgi:hypothetical protein
MALAVLYPVFKNTLLHRDFFQILNKICHSSTAKGLRAECHSHTKIKDVIAGISHLQQKVFRLFPKKVGKNQGPMHFRNRRENDYVITRWTST